MGQFGEIAQQIRGQRLEVLNPLAGQQALDAVRVAQKLREQALTLARQPPRIRATRWSRSWDSIRWFPSVIQRVSVPKF